MNERSLANLRPAKKGEVRNPRGKPKGIISLQRRLQKELKKEIKLPDGTVISRMDFVIRGWVMGAATKPALLELLMAYLYGKPVVEISGPEGRPLESTRPVIVVASEEAKRAVDFVIDGHLPGESLPPGKDEGDEG